MSIEIREFQMIPSPPTETPPATHTPALSHAATAPGGDISGAVRRVLAEAQIRNERMRAD